MWALGVIMYTIIGGCPPFYDSTNQGTFGKILAGEFTFDDENWGHISGDCKDVIRNLLVLDPKKRWSTEECLDSRWMKGDPSVLSSISLRPNQLRLQDFRAKQKMKAAVYAVIGMNRLADTTES
jgi:serine/threonine protein kinase